MTRGVWAGVAACALCVVGCNTPRYYTPPTTQLPSEKVIDGVAYQFQDQRPEWEKQPFTGVVCLYHLDKAQPGPWAQLTEETSAVIAAMPQKPERVEVTVSSFRLVRAGDTGGRFRDFSQGPNANPNARVYDSVRSSGEERERKFSQSGVMTADSPAQTYTNAADKHGNDVELLFASKDDPRRKLRDHPNGASCALQANVRLIFPGGREQTVDVKTIARGANETGTVYWGEALDFAAKAAVRDFGRQFRSGVGLNLD